MIHKRHYLLADGFGKKIMEYSSLQKSFVFLSELRKKDIQKMIKEVVPSLEEKVKKSSLMSTFWEKASKKMRDDLALSYYYHEHEKNKKVLNVETENWFSMSYFGNLHASVLKKRWLIWRKPALGFAAFRNTLGKHYVNLRFENIHLAVDRIGKQYIYQIHWDIKYPQTPKKIFAHFFLDDFIG